MRETASMREQPGLMLGMLPSGMVGHARALPKKLEAGDLVAGKFVVERTIGEGGMGQVVVARHQELGTRVAIKVVHADAAADPDNITRFKREARAMARLRSEHVVRVYDVGETDTGLPFLIMEYLEGRDLGSLLAERGPLPVDDVIGYMIQACEALLEAHEIGIVHRDLKPQNLFLSRRTSRALDSDGEGHLRVLDFGLAKPFTGFGAAPESMKLTRPGEIVGTSHYMAPEQVRGDVLDGRVDIWGAGACLFRLLTQKYPFGGGGAAITCASILAEPPANLRQLRSEIGAPVEAIVTRCLQKRPGDRYASMRELMSALQNVKRSASLPSLTAAMPVAVREQVTMLLEARSSSHIVAAAPSSVSGIDATMRTSQQRMPSRTAPMQAIPPVRASQPSYPRASQPELSPASYGIGPTSMPTPVSLPPASLPMAPPRLQKRKRSIWLWVLITVWVLVLFVAGAGWALHRGGRTGNRPPRQRLEQAP